MFYRICIFDSFWSITSRPLDLRQIPEEFVEASSMIHSVGYIAAQPIYEQRSTQGFSSLVDLLVPPLEFLVATSAGILAHLLCLYLFALALEKLFGKSRKTYLQIKILSFFFLLFWFLIEQFYNGNLSTERITVDVSDLLHSEKQLLNTRKESCFFDKDGELNLFKNAQKNTLAYKLYLKMNSSDPCFVEAKEANLADTLAKKNLNRVFWLGLDVATDFLAKIVQFFGKVDTFINDKPIWQSPRALILRKSLEKNFRNYFNRAINIYCQFGFFSKAFRDFPFSIVLGRFFLKFLKLFNLI